MEMAALTANVQAYTHVEEMVKLQEENAKLKEELQTLQSNHDKLDDEFNSLTGLHYQLKLACLWTTDQNRQLALEFDRIDQQYKKKNTQRDWGLTSWISPDDMFPWKVIFIKMRQNHNFETWRIEGECFQESLIIPLNSTSSHSHLCQQ